MAPVNTFGAWDYVMLGIMLLISASIGVYYRFTGGKQKTTQEYLLGNRSMSMIPVSFSLMAGYISAVTLLGGSTEIYNYGTQFVAIYIGYGFTNPIVAYIYLPVFFKLQNTSVYKYFEQRFGVYMRLAASSAFSIQLLVYMGIVLYAPALALEAVTGLSKAGSILAVGCVCTFYSTIGGVKAVIIADVFQSVLMMIAIYLVVIKGTIDAGGFGEVWRIAQEGGRIQFDSISADPTERHTWWGLVIGGCFIQLTLYAVNQVQVQRLLTVKDLRTSQMAVFLSWPILCFISYSSAYAGLVIYAKYVYCDPALNGQINSSDQLMPFYVMDTLSHIPSIAGLYTAGVFSGSLSSVSSALNSLAAVTLEDYLKPLYLVIKKKPVPETHLALIVKFIACFFGGICIAMAFLAEFFGGILQASYTLFGVVGGPILGIFTLGMFTTFGNEPGAVTGLLSGIGLMIWIGFGGPRPAAQKLPMSTEQCSAGNFTKHVFSSPMTSAELYSESVPQDEYFYLYRISYVWYSLMGVIISFVIGSVVSLVVNKFNKKPRDLVDPDLLTPMVRHFVLKYRARRESHKSNFNESTNVKRVNEIKVKENGECEEKESDKSSHKCASYYEGIVIGESDIPVNNLKDDKVGPNGEAIDLIHDTRDANCTSIVNHEVGSIDGDKIITDHESHVA